MPTTADPAAPAVIHGTVELTQGVGTVIAYFVQDDGTTLNIAAVEDDDGFLRRIEAHLAAHRIVRTTGYELTELGVLAAAAGRMA